MVWWRCAAHRLVAVTAQVATSTQPAASLSQIEQAFQANDAAAKDRRLLQWAQRAGPGPATSPGSVGKAPGDESAVVLDEDRPLCLYAGQPQHWDGVAAWDRLAP